VSSPSNRAVLNVFGREEDRSSGNPATVIWLDHEIESRQMAGAAREAGTPVCVFLLPGSPLRARFFTATSTLSFCGHGALAAGVAEAIRRGRSFAHLAIDGHELRVERAQDGLSYLVLPAEGMFASESHPEPVLAALGLAPQDLDARKHVTVASVGSPKWLVRVRSIDILRALQPEMQALTEVSEAAKINGAYVYAAGPAAGPADIVARGFNPYGGVPEDAATGAAAAALAWSERDELQGRWLVIDQGIGLARLNRIHVRIRDGEIHLGGNVMLAESATST